MTPLDPFLLAPAAFLAGVLMFLAPCTLPIVPGYLAFIAGKQGRVMANALAFVIGFSIVFIVLGAFAGFLGAFLAPWRGALGMAAGAVLIFFGLVMLGVRIPLLSGQKNFTPPAWL
ncbi:MAG: cytochrome c biogenesis protein CcdA, partial [Patescibacteria group bacterium]|nr:cytochrome c biogenesis protein CcdA [Patescibacteria group bacterium]